MDQCDIGIQKDEVDSNEVLIIERIGEQMVPITFQGTKSIKDKAESQTQKEPRLKGLCSSEKKLKKNKKGPSPAFNRFGYRFMANQEDQIFEEDSSSQNLKETKRNKNSFKTKKTSKISRNSPTHCKDSSLKKKTRTVGTQYQLNTSSKTLPDWESQELKEYKSFVQKTDENFRKVYARISELEKQSLRNNMLPEQPKEKRKKLRRKAAQINRKYSCGLQGCNKRYGSRSSVKIHIERFHKFCKQDIKIVQNVAQVRYSRNMRVPYQVEHEHQFAIDFMYEHQYGDH